MTIRLSGLSSIILLDDRMHITDNSISITDIPANDNFQGGPMRNGWSWCLFAILAAILGVFIAQPLLLLAQAAAPAMPPINDNPPTISEWIALWQSLGQAKGLGTLGAVALAVQVLLLLARSSFDPLPGPIKLLVVTGLTLVLGIVSMKVTTGIDWMAALTHSSVLAMAQVFANQVYQQLNPPAVAKA